MVVGKYIHCKVKLLFRDPYIEYRICKGDYVLKSDIKSLIYNICYK